MLWTSHTCHTSFLTRMCSTYCDIKLMDSRRSWTFLILLILVGLIFFTFLEDYSTHMMSDYILYDANSSAVAWFKSKTNTPEDEIQPHKIKPYFLNKLHADDNPEWGFHRLGVIIPMRDRFEELMQFIPYMHNYLNAKKIRHIFYAINQADGLRFNRASLINVGFLQAEPLCDYIAMHDVDLLPVNQDLDYGFPSKGPYHVAAPNLHPKYHYETFVGGILLLTAKHFRMVDGMSNKYWGWGKEDDEFYTRLGDKQLIINRPVNISTGLNTFIHIHSRRRIRDQEKYYGQSKQRLGSRDRETGLSNLKYRLESAIDTTFAGAPVTVVNVKLVCDLGRTPWCITPSELKAVEQNAILRRAVVNTSRASGDVRKLLEKLQDKVSNLPPVDMDDFILPKEPDRPYR